MQQQLTADELRALLSQEVTAPKKRATGRRRLYRVAPAQPYDLQASLTLTPRHRAILHQLGEQLAQSLRYALIPTLRMTVELRLHSEELTTLTALTEGWQENVFVAPILAFGRLRGEHYWAMSNNLAMVAVDRLLGGPGLFTSPLRRSPSRLEVNLILRFVERLSEALLNVVGADSGEESSVQTQGLMTTTEQISVLSDSISVYAFAYEVQLGSETGQLWLCLRAEAVKGLEQPTNRRTIPDPQRLQQHPISVLPLSLRVVLAEGTLSFHEMRQLRVGDVIVLNSFRGEPIRVIYGERTLFLACPGARGGQLAVQVLAAKTPSEQGGTK